MIIHYKIYFMFFYFHGLHKPQKYFATKISRFTVVPGHTVKLVCRVTIRSFAVGAQVPCSSYLHFP